MLRLPVCWSCQYKFKWSELLFVIEGRKTCPLCSAKQYVTSHSKWLQGWAFIPLILFYWITVMFTLNVSFPVYLVIGLLYFGAYWFLILPYQYEFTDEKQQLV
ncbi:TIGR04104 family putative zinc finger protein [Salicibibacter cibi]|uniref:TIGR04104 family putative zinc finger protein n=1 Tax=Salicibibacter cibi TaxID=2743001 RepID=UPI003CCE535D